MKIYHTTTKEAYEKYIKNEGLKPICIRELKNFPKCENALYFFIDFKAAVSYGVQEFEEDITPPKKWIILAVDIIDVLDSCYDIMKDMYDPSAIEAHPKIVHYGDGSYDNYTCEITSDKITKIYESD